MKNLNALGLKYGTDKASFNGNYLNTYEKILDPIKDKITSFLEIGVHKGDSLRMWREYFQNIQIIGVDINPNCKFEEPNIKVEIGDASSTIFTQKLINKYGPFDVVIDDGSHRTSHMVQSFNLLFPYVKSGGYYIIEDLGTQTDSPDILKLGNFQDMKNFTFFDFTKEILLDFNKYPEVNSFYSEKIEQIIFEKWICFIKKK